MEQLVRLLTQTLGLLMKTLILGEGFIQPRDDASLLRHARNRQSQSLKRCDTDARAPDPCDLVYLLPIPEV